MNLPNQTTFFELAQLLRRRSDLKAQLDATNQLLDQFLIMAATLVAESFPSLLAEFGQASTPGPRPADWPQFTDLSKDKEPSDPSAPTHSTLGEPLARNNIPEGCELQDLGNGMVRGSIKGDGAELFACEGTSEQVLEILRARLAQ